MPLTQHTPHEPTALSRFMAAWWGPFIGDALTMPAHWYYRRELIRQDYGEINDYTAPKNPHPDSILWRSQHKTTCKQDDILHDQAQYWGKPGIHYHQFLKAGENTLNLKISTLLAESLIDASGYDQADFARRYIDFMLSGDSHRDTYVEEYHRAFFTNYAKGKPLRACGIEDTHIGCLATLTPLILFYHRNYKVMLEKVREHMSLTHKGENAATAGELYAKTIYHTLRGGELEHILFNTIGRDHYQSLTYPYRRWIEKHTDEEIVGKVVSSACYLEDAMPATVYLAIKYQKDFKLALMKNLYLGGDNCHRAVPLGAIVGSRVGYEGIPKEWLHGLVEKERYEKLGSEIWHSSLG